MIEVFEVTIKQHYPIGVREVEFAVPVKLSEEDITEGVYGDCEAVKMALYLFLSDYVLSEGSKIEIVKVIKR
ncbi:hypothetical protein [Paenibacillus naphthalenovorans]|uniref:Uncharacterized protein n=1 Tax=Paenibacillus naphthalenovorans TaxID=162209 RepID=A0A0U2M3U0_9BACL|nr:hypothetical protein [Paenibacillus naphthalenovorans]ALS22112.1 hypothetical protein IJ22_17380 [Paenibacillus naphthalenovorans]